MYAQMERRSAYYEFAGEGHMIDLIKKTSIKAVASGNPVNLLYGTVEKSKPLEIRVHEKLKLTEEFIDVVESLTRHDRIISIDYDFPKTWTKQQIGDAKKDASSKRNNKGASPDPYENVNIKYAKMTFEDGLKVGDKVILARIQGGHRYLVIDRYKRGEDIWSYR